MKRFLLDVVAPAPTQRCGSRRTAAALAARGRDRAAGSRCSRPAPRSPTASTSPTRATACSAISAPSTSTRLKVFETIEITSRYLDELLYDVTDEQIRADEALYNARLRALTDTLPQLADIWVDRVRRPSGRVRHGVPDAAAARPVRPRLFPRAPRQSEVGVLCRRRGAVARHQRARPAALLRAQPQAHRHRTASSPA